MSFARNLDFRTEGIRVRAPLKSRSLDGVIADLWQAEGRKGAGGYYLSPNPRFVIFFSDVERSIRIATEAGGIETNHRPIGRAVYIPGGVPMWSRFTSPHQFRHLDLYMDVRVLHAMLTPRLGAAAAAAAIRKPVEMGYSADIELLAGLVSGEVSHPQRHALYAESLIQSIASGMLALPAADAVQHRGLSEVQLGKLRNHILAHIHRRVSNAELADEAGLSESWFASVFKQTTGQTPQQWQSRLRVERARDILVETKDSLSDVAYRLGFADQAHLTRVFRSSTGVTPAVWRRQNAAF